MPACRWSNSFISFITHRPPNPEGRYTADGSATPPRGKSRTYRTGALLFWSTTIIAVRDRGGEGKRVRKSETCRVAEWQSHPQGTLTLSQGEREFLRHKRDNRD
jgi:hypothetical protein